MTSARASATLAGHPIYVHPSISNISSSFHNTSKISRVIGFVPLVGGDRGSVLAPCFGIVLDLARGPPANASWMGLFANSVARGDMTSSVANASDRGRSFSGLRENSTVRGENRAASAIFDDAEEIGSLPRRRCADCEDFEDSGLLDRDNVGFDDIEEDCFEVESECFELDDDGLFVDEVDALSGRELDCLDDVDANRCGSCPLAVSSRGDVNPIVKVSPISDGRIALMPNSVPRGVANGWANMCGAAVANLSSLGDVIPNERSLSCCHAGAIANPVVAWSGLAMVLAKPRFSTGGA